MSMPSSSDQNGMISSENKAVTNVSKPPKGLYLVATPIGNLGDISKRATEILSGVDFIACEDKRITAKLLNALKINKPLLNYHEHNAEKMLARISQKGKSRRFYRFGV